MAAIEVLDPGFLTTVQDQGRFGYQRYGVPVSGAMDLFACRVANCLVGNDLNAATLEMTLIGPRLRFLSDAVIAVTGADLQPTRDGWVVPAWSAVPMSEGAVLECGAACDGLRGYLALAGGIDVPAVLGSRSTFVRGGLGGFRGRPLQASDRLESGPARLETILARTMPRDRIPRYGHEHVLRVLPGPQDDAFSVDALEDFLKAQYAVSPKSDRIGCRLEGPVIRHKQGADIVSDGIPFGAVQVAGDGLPMILLADRGTTGGYTKIATVISADVGVIAQATPGDRVSFRAVTLEEAVEAFEQQQAAVRAVAVSAPVQFERRVCEISMAGERFVVDTGIASRVSEPEAVVAAQRIHVTCNGLSASIDVEVTAGQRQVAVE